MRRQEGWKVVAPGLESSQFVVEARRIFEEQALSLATARSGLERELCVHRVWEALEVWRYQVPDVWKLRNALHISTQLGRFSGDSSGVVNWFE